MAINNVKYFLVKQDMQKENNVGLNCIVQSGLY